MSILGKSKGFTLIEIVIVIGIMGVMSAIIYSSFDTSRAKSRDQKRVSDVSTIQLALEQYFQKNGVYPITLDKLLEKPSGYTNAYLSELPKAPLSGEQYYYLPIVRTANIDPTQCTSYQLWTKFEISNAFLDSKKGFNSSNLPKNGLNECKGSDQAGIDASVPGSLIYDVMP